MSALEYDASTTMAMRSGTSLLRALSEHGLSKCPDGTWHNSFAFAELVGRDDAMLAGKAVRRHWGAFCLNFESRLPLEFAGARVQLSGGRLHIVKDGAP